MSKRHLLIAGLLLGLVAIAIWQLKGKSASESSPEAETKQAEKRQPVRSTSRLSAGFDVLADDDLAGALQLEGQVIDDIGDPVEGALVTLSSNPPRQLTTGEDGTFVFDKLRARTYRLTARGNVGAAGPVTARLSDVSDPVILRVRPSSTVLVAALSADERLPIGGADIELRGAITVRARTDADGVAELTAVPSGRYQIAALADGYATSRQLIRISSASNAYREEVLLHRGAQVTGRVVDSDKKPISGARVTYASSSDRRNRAHPRFDAVLTADDGTYVIDALARGTYRLIARTATHAPGSSEPLTLDGKTAHRGVEIVLEPGARLTGRVEMADGTAAPGALVRASRNARRGRPRQTFADEQGRFEMAGLAKASLSVVALTESATSKTLQIDLSSGELPAGESEVVLVVDLDGRIAGRVVDSAGEPVDGAQVRLVPNMRAGASMTRADFRLRGVSIELSDAGGRFEFRGLSDNPFLLQASPPGVTVGRRPRMRGGVEAEVGDTDIEIVLEKRAMIVGRVAFADGSAPGPFSISAGGFRAPPVPFNSKDGRFELGDLEPRGYRVTIRGPSFEDRSVTGVQVGPGETVDIGTVTVARGRRVAGRVVDPSGGGIENATVMISSRLRGSGLQANGAGRRGLAARTKETTTDESGAFVLAGVGDGELALVAEHPSKGRSVSVNVPASQAPTNLQVVLVPPGSVEGIVSVNGTPTPSVRVTARSKTATGASFTVASGDNGRYRFDVLAPDDYLLSASVGRMRGGGSVGSVSRTVTLASGANETVNLEMATGGESLIVTATGPEDGLGFGIVHLVDGAVSATTAAEIDRMLAVREGGFAARSIIRGGESATFKELTAGEYTVCVVAFPDEVFGPATIAYSEREGARLALACQAVRVGSGENKVSVPVVVPPFVPEPE